MRLHDPDIQPRNVGPLLPEVSQCLKPSTGPFPSWTRLPSEGQRSKAKIGDEIEYGNPSRVARVIGRSHIEGNTWALHLSSGDTLVN